MRKLKISECEKFSASSERDPDRNQVCALRHVPRRLHRLQRRQKRRFDESDSGNLVAKRARGLDAIDTTEPSWRLHFGRQGKHKEIPTSLVLSKSDMERSGSRLLQTIARGDGKMAGDPVNITMNVNPDLLKLYANNNLKLDRWKMSRLLKALQSSGAYGNPRVHNALLSELAGRIRRKASLKRSTLPRAKLEAIVKEEVDKLLVGGMVTMRKMTVQGVMEWLGWHACIYIHNWRENWGFRLKQVAFSRDGRKLVVLDLDSGVSGISLCDISNLEKARREIIRREPGTSSPLAFALSPDDAQIVWSVHEDNDLRVTSVADGTRISGYKHDESIFEGIYEDWPTVPGPRDDMDRDIIAQNKRIFVLNYSSDGGRIVSGFGSVACIWDVLAPNAPPLLILPGKDRYVSVISAKFSPDGKQVATSYGKVVRIWDARTGSKLQTLKFDSDSKEEFFPRGVPSGDFLQYLADGKRIAAAFKERVVIWDLETGSKLSEYNTGSFYIVSISITPDARKLILAMRGNRFHTRMEILDVATGKIMKKIKSTSQGLGRATISPDGRRVATAGGNRLCIWNLPILKMGSRSH